MPHLGLATVNYIASNWKHFYDSSILVLDDISNYEVVCVYAKNLMEMKSNYGKIDKSKW